MDTRCSFWLPRKRRFCSSAPLHGSSFCGNHNPRSSTQSKWIVCPIDPSHSVLEENLESHVKRCPLLKTAQFLASQAYYEKGINAGKNGGGEENVTSLMKRNAVYAMNVVEFRNLLRKIQSIHSELCNDIRDSYMIPEACGIWIKGEVDRKLPFQEKHVLQQASILGNLEGMGVLKNSLSIKQNEVDCRAVTAVIEFGAGRGYLTQMLADCYGINKVFLVERKSYKLKADRSLRQKESLILERVRIDIEDLNLNAVESLRGAPYLATGKHLCGPATDLTLRCCMGEQCSQDTLDKSSSHHSPTGLAIATCCHHLCQWKHYINEKYLHDLGISKDEFHAITWFTSWAVDADHSTDLPDAADVTLPLDSIWNEECGKESANSVDDIVRNMEAVERAVLGFMCKQIIDIGRSMWIEECGFETKLVKYVPSTISPENHLLVAKWTKKL